MMILVWIALAKAAFALLEAIKNPYQDNPEFSTYSRPPTSEEEAVYQTFCGT